jgi:hypothetical protein
MKKTYIAIILVIFLFISGSSCATEPKKPSIWKRIDVNVLVKHGPGSATLVTERLDLKQGYIIRTTAIGCNAISVHHIYVTAEIKGNKF